MVGVAQVIASIAITLAAVVIVFVLSRVLFVLAQFSTKNDLMLSILYIALFAGSVVFVHKMMWGA